MLKLGCYGSVLPVLRWSVEKGTVASVFGVCCCPLTCFESQVEPGTGCPCRPTGPAVGAGVTVGGLWFVSRQHVCDSRTQRTAMHFLSRFFK